MPEETEQPTTFDEMHAKFQARLYELEARESDGVDLPTMDEWEDLKGDFEPLLHAAIDELTLCRRALVSLYEMLVEMDRTPTPITHYIATTNFDVLAAADRALAAVHDDWRERFPYVGPTVSQLTTIVSQRNDEWWVYVNGPDEFPFDEPALLARIVEGGILVVDYAHRDRELYFDSQTPISERLNAAIVGALETLLAD